MSSPMPFIVIGGLICLSSSVGAALMMGGEKDAGGADIQDDDAEPEPEPQFVYDFIIKQKSVGNPIISDIKADGVRVTSDQLTLHEVPGAKVCASQANGYECEDDNYGMNDPEPEEPAKKDRTWSTWKADQNVVDTKLFTVTMPSKVSEFEIVWWKPKHKPGLTIMENGVEAVSKGKGGNINEPNPQSVKYQIP